MKVQDAMKTFLRRATLRAFSSNQRSSDDVTEEEKNKRIRDYLNSKKPISQRRDDDINNIYHVITEIERDQYLKDLEAQGRKLNRGKYQHYRLKKVYQEFNSRPESPD